MTEADDPNRRPPTRGCRRNLEHDLARAEERSHAVAIGRGDDQILDAVPDVPVDRMVAEISTARTAKPPAPYKSARCSPQRCVRRQPRSRAPRRQSDAYHGDSYSSATQGLHREIRGEDQ